jgi:hypothetical protein
VVKRVEHEQDFRLILGLVRTNLEGIPIEPRKLLLNAFLIYLADHLVISPKEKI